MKHIFRYAALYLALTGVLWAAYSALPTGTESAKRPAWAAGGAEVLAGRKAAEPVGWVVGLPGDRLHTYRGHLWRNGRLEPDAWVLRKEFQIHVVEEGFCVVIEGGVLRRFSMSD